MLLAAGKGTRLKPYTNDKPKCLMPIKGKPLLDIWINKLCNVGVKNFFINTHYLHEQVNEFVSRNELKEKIQLSHELELLGLLITRVKQTTSASSNLHQSYPKTTNLHSIQMSCCFFSSTPFLPYGGNEHYHQQRDVYSSLIDF